MSEFDSKPLQETAGIDFTKAKRIKTSGSTCDAYELYYHHRHVFVKRLKEEFRLSPRHLTAFRKEYETGVSLTHPSLPVYTDSGEDYMVMNFIDGRTLADMILKQDSWLSNVRNICKMLIELLEVVDYLHQRDIRHCDIKADNILITNSTRKLVLIDLDKCHTDWFEDSAGSSSLYGVTQEKTGSIDVDFHGISQLVDQLIKSIPNFPKQKFTKFRNDCLKEGINIEKLKEDLSERNVSMAWMVVLPLIAIVIVGMIIWNPSSNSEEDRINDGHYISKDTIIILQTPVIETSKEVSPDNIPNNNVTTGFPTNEEINKELAPMLNGVNQKIDSIRDLLAKPSIDPGILQNELSSLISVKSEITQKAYSYFESKYPDENPVKIQMAVAGSKAYKKILRDMELISKQITDSIQSMEGITR